MMVLFILMYILIKVFNHQHHMNIMLQQFVKEMKVESNTVTAETDSSYVCTTYTSSNYDHVTAGRAYQDLGECYAVGSNDDMGLYNTFTTTTLAETSEDYYIVGNCPTN